MFVVNFNKVYLLKTLINMKYTNQVSNFELPAVFQSPIANRI